MSASEAAAREARRAVEAIRQDMKRADEEARREALEVTMKEECEVDARRDMQEAQIREEARDAEARIETRREAREAQVRREAQEAEQAVLRVKAATSPISVRSCTDACEAPMIH